MYFKAQQQTVIRGVVMPSVVSVKTSNDGQKIGQLCDLVVPLNCYIPYKDANSKTVYLNAQLTNYFKSGDPVSIKARYEGMPTVDVFDGFIYDFVEGMPLTIKCMDYFYWFNLGVFGNDRVFAKKSKNSKITSQGQGVHYSSITLKSLLENLITFVNHTIDNYNTENGSSVQRVSLFLPIPDLTLVNLTFMNISPAGVLEYLRKNVGFNINMIGSQLYFNIASNTLSNAVLDTGVNVFKSSLQKPLATFQKLRVKCWFIREDGTRDSFDIGDESGDMKELFFYKIKRDNNLYEALAKNALLKYSQYKFSGEVETPLYPDCGLFWSVDFTNRRYPDQNGRYAVIKDDIFLNEKGFRRLHKLTYLVDLDQQ